jgi:hypothetical protein
MNDGRAEMRCHISAGAAEEAVPRCTPPEQIAASDALGQDNVDNLVSKQDARYDAMTEEERDKYYVHPNLITKIKKALRGE